jgi:hypothetical protein
MKEREHQELLDGFWLSFAPVWFRWLSIICMMAGLKWICDKSGDHLIGAIYTTSLFACWFHFSALFCRDSGWLMRHFQRSRWAYLLGLCLGTAMAAVAYWLSLALAGRIAMLTH